MEFLDSASPLDAAETIIMIRDRGSIAAYLRAFGRISSTQYCVGAAQCSCAPKNTVETPEEESMGWGAVEQRGVTVSDWAAALGRAKNARQQLVSAR